MSSLDLYDEIRNPREISKLCSCSAVVSSSSRIFSSTNVLISGVITVGLPELGRLTMVLVSSYLRKSLAMPTLEATMSSSSNSDAIDGAR